jgi:hypothetical protein
MQARFGRPRTEAMDAQFLHRFGASHEYRKPSIRDGWLESGPGTRIDMLTTGHFRKVLGQEDDESAHPSIKCLTSSND